MWKDSEISTGIDSLNFDDVWAVGIFVAIQGKAIPARDGRTWKVPNHIRARSAIGGSGSDFLAMCMRGLTVARKMARI